MRKSISLRTRFAASLGTLIIVLTVILSSVIGSQSSYQVREEIGNSLAHTSYQMGNRLDQYMWARSMEIDVLSKLQVMKNPSELNSVQTLLEQLKKNIPAFSWIGLTDAKGKVVASTGNILHGVDISQRPVYIEGMKGPFVGDVHDAVLLAKLLPNPSGEPMKFVDVSTPVYDSDGKVSGVLAAHLSWDWAKQIQALMLNPLNDKKEVDVFVVSSKDNTVLLGPSDMIGHPLKLQCVKLAQANENKWILEKWPDGKEYLTGYSKGIGYMNYKGLGWSILVRERADLAYAPVNNLRNFIIIFGALFTIIFAVFGWFIAGRIVEPLHRISEAADRLRKGEIVEIPEYKGIIDIENLSYSLRNLVSSLTQTETKLGNMEELAQHDHLTGLPNRVALANYMDDVIEKGVGDNALTYLYLDLDGFKAINDTHGHYTGDLLLKEVASRLLAHKACGELVVRLGGDEFVMVLHSSIDKAIENGKKVGKAVIKHLSEPFIIEGKELKVGCSVGGAVWPIHGSDPMEVMNLADKALYDVKRSGKGKVLFYPMATDRNTPASTSGR